jgi:ferredoxin-NADP reductase
MQVFFESRRELAPTIWEYSFRPARIVDFVPGQYVDVRLPQVKNDPRGSGRTLTIVSLPSEASLRFVVKHSENESFYKQTLSALKPGAEATITDAMGDVVLPKLGSIPLVFVAGGIGLASFISILRSLESSGEHRNISLLYGRRARHELIYPELLKSFPFAHKQLLVSPQRILAKDILAAAGSEAMIYISGSQKFVEELSLQLRQHGIGNERIVFDYFDGYRDDQV